MMIRLKSRLVAVPFELFSLIELMSAIFDWH